MLILGSGTVVHNLRRVQCDQPDAAFAQAVPTPDHFIPLLYIAALAAADGVAAEAIVRGYSLGSISMSCHGVGTGEMCREAAGGAAKLPPGVPPEQTNT